MYIRTHPTGCGRMYIIGCSILNSIYSVHQTQKQKLTSFDKKLVSFLAIVIAKSIIGDYNIDKEGCL